MAASLRGIWELLTGTVNLWMSRNAFQMAGALAFYTLFSMAPLLIILIAVVGTVLGEGAAQGEIAAQIEEYVGPRAAEAVEGAVERSQLRESGLLPTLLGVGAVLFGATTVFGQLQSSLNQMWEVAASSERSGVVNFVIGRLLSLAMVFIIGGIFLASFLATMALSTLLGVAEEWVPIPPFVAALTDLVVSLVIAAALFAMIFKVLPDVVITWRDTWRGAVLTAVLFVIGQALISLYLTRTAPGSPYGAAGSLVLVLVWVYYSSLILFLGAAYTRVAVQRAGRRLEPTEHAVKVRTEVLGDES